MWNGHFCLFMDRCLKFDVADATRRVDNAAAGAAVTEAPWPSSASVPARPLLSSASASLIRK